MKKITILMAAIALVCFSVPAMAVDWNFYGSARMGTWYDSKNPKDTGEKNTDFRWEWQGNSRIGANVKADHIKGQFELALKGSSTPIFNESGDRAGESGDGGDTTVDTRRLYGTWNFGAGSLKVGKDYTPVSVFVSGQLFDDAGLVGFGAPYGSRPGQLALTFGGFEVAFITPKVTRNLKDTSDGSTGERARGDEKRIIPKLEASYGMSFDAWNFDVFGGYQYYSLKDVENVAMDNIDDITVTSYIVGASGQFNFGPAFVGAQLMYGQNMGNAAWFGGAADDAGWDGDDSTNDVNSYGGILIGGFKMSDMLTFEAGFGYIVDDPKDADSGFDEKTKAWDAYVQALITMAPGVYIAPSIGYRDLGKNPGDEDKGNHLYLGAKWQIDF